MSGTLAVCPEYSIVEYHPRSPMDLYEIKPEIASDVDYWSKAFGVSRNLLLAVIGRNGTKVDTVRAAIARHEISLP